MKSAILLPFRASEFPLRAFGLAAMALVLCVPGATAQNNASNSAASPAASSAAGPTPAETADGAGAQSKPAPQPLKAAPAQATPVPPDSGNPADPGFTIRQQVNEVNLIFTVTDGQGHYVKDLQQQNFGLLDDRKPPEQVFNFTQQTNLPLRVGIMLDTSNSVRGRFKFEQDAAKEFLLEVLRPGKDKAFVEGFDVQIELSQPFTDNIDLLNQGITKLQPGGGTALFDSLYRTCRDQLLTIKDRRSTRKAIVLVSDGDDVYSHSLEQDAIQECQRAEAIIYAISTNVSPSKDKGDDVLKSIAESTGGRAFFPKRIEDISIHFHDIEDELRSQYSLEYKPADFKADGSFRSVYLVALNRKYTVRVRKGYYAPN